MLQQDITPRDIQLEVNEDDNLIQMHAFPKLTHEIRKNIKQPTRTIVLQQEPCIEMSICGDGKVNLFLYTDTDFLQCPTIFDYVRMLQEVPTKYEKKLKKTL